MPTKPGTSKTKALSAAASSPAKRSPAKSPPAAKAAGKVAAKASAKSPEKSPQKSKGNVVSKVKAKAPARAAAAPAKTSPKATKTAARATATASARPAPATRGSAPSLGPAALKRAAATSTVATKESAKVTKANYGTKGTHDKEALRAIQQRLLEQRQELENQLTAIEQSALGLSQSEMSGEVSYDEDYADAGSFTFEREKEFSIANNVTDLRSKIDRALHKIHEGSYGICESCGQPIEAPRLKALPHVTLCLKCKKAEERR